MTGLICKDLVLIKRSMGSTILILAFLVVLFSTMMGIAAGMAMIPIVFAMMILSTFILDDSAKWDAFASVSYTHLDVYKRQSSIRRT